MENCFVCTLHCLESEQIIFLFTSFHSRYFLLILFSYIENNSFWGSSFSSWIFRNWISISLHPCSEEKRRHNSHTFKDLYSYLCNTVCQYVRWHLKLPCDVIKRVCTIFALFFSAQCNTHNQTLWLNNKFHFRFIRVFHICDVIFNG